VAHELYMEKKFLVMFYCMYMKKISNNFIQKKLNMFKKKKKNQI